MTEPTESPDLVATAKAPPAEAPPRRRVLLVIVDRDIRSVDLPLAGEVTIGRGTTNDVQVDHPSMSRAHLRLALSENAIAVIDEGSANGTALRGARVPAGVAVQVAANEPIAAGDVVLAVQEVRPFDGAGGAGAGVATPKPPARGVPSDPIVLDPAMRRVYDLAARVAQGTIGVLLGGETGVGKEVLAEFVHRASPRAAGPLVKINCAALAESLVESELFGHEKGAFTGAARDRRGLLEAAHGGTVFLDEVGELSAAVQAKLLRVLEEGSVLPVGATTPRAVDVRYVAASNRDLEAEVEAGRFRRDLYFRLAGVVLVIPPLRARGDELEALARRFAATTATRLGRPEPQLTERAIAALRAHPWPGNVRELVNVVERAVLLAQHGAIDVDELGLATSPAPSTPVAPAASSTSPAPTPVAPPAALAGELANLERQRILDAIEACAGNQTRAAERLGMPRRTLLKRLDEYGIKRPRKQR